MALQRHKRRESGRCGARCGRTCTTIASLGLKPGTTFHYWFDFGDDWWHEIRVVSIGEPVSRRRYPRVVARVGESPPQYPEWDEVDA